MRLKIRVGGRRGFDYASRRAANLGEDRFKIGVKIVYKTQILKELAKIDQKSEISAKFHVEWHGQIPIST